MYNKYRNPSILERGYSQPSTNPVPSVLLNTPMKRKPPTKPWDAVTTRLHDIDAHKLHYVKIPENHIVIDFDIKDETDKKSFEKNLEVASKFPPTYAELSKSGAGIHLHYIL